MCFVEELGPFPKESTLYPWEFEPFCKKNSLLLQKVIFFTMELFLFHGELT
jgi:hypothetical protein